MSAIDFNELYMFALRSPGMVPDQMFAWPGAPSSAQTAGRLDVTSRSLGT